MKKIIISIAIIMLMMPLVNALAENSTKPETIKFMGLDWLITPEQFENTLTEKEIKYRTEYSSTGEQTDYWFPFVGMGYGIYEHNNYKIPYYTATYYPPKKANGDVLGTYITTVAGYKVDYITTQYGPSYSIEQLKVGKPYRLMRAKYNISSYDLPKKVAAVDAYEDLKAKLTSVYGEPTYQTDKKDGNYLRLSYWYAEDGTGVALDIFYISLWNICSIEIQYGIADDRNYINDILGIYETQKQQTIDSNLQNTDGL